MLACTMTLDLERFVTETTMTSKAISTSRQETRVILGALDRVRSVLSTMLTLGLNEEIATICVRKLGIRSSKAGVGMSRSVLRFRCSFSVRVADERGAQWDIFVIGVLLCESGSGSVDDLG